MSHRSQQDTTAARSTPLTTALLAASAGACLALALPGLSWSPLVLVFPGLLLETLGRARTPMRAAAWGWAAGTISWVVAASWVLPVMSGYGGLELPLAGLCLVAMAALLGLSWGAVTLVAFPVSPARRIWLLPLAWAAVEAWRQLPPYIFPWNPTASAVSDLPIMLASLPIWGATGLGWAMTSAGAGIWGLLRTETRRSGAAALGVAISLTIGLSAAAPDASPSGDPMTIAIAQPVTLLEERWNPESWDVVMDRVRSLSIEAAEHEVDLVLWPEGSVPLVVESNSEYRRWLIDTTHRAGAPILVSSVGIRDDGQYANSAYLVPHEGPGLLRHEIWQRYDKVRLVPFGEYVPRLARVLFSESLVREVGHFVPGDRPRIVDVDGHGIGVAICYEIVFADLVASQVRLGAELLTTVTNDAWYGNSWAPHQHFAQAVLRAAESRRWMARAALTGISGAVDPYGRTAERLELGVNGLIVAEVTPDDTLTPRTRLGDWWGLLCGLTTMLWLGILVGRRVRRSPSAGLIGARRGKQESSGAPESVDPQQGQAPTTSSSP